MRRKRRLRRICLLFIAAQLSGLRGPACAQALQREHSPVEKSACARGRIIVKFKDVPGAPLFAPDPSSPKGIRRLFQAGPAGLKAAPSAFRRRAMRAPKSGKGVRLSNIYILDLDPDLDEAAAARELAGDPRVEYAQTDGIAQTALLPNDPYLSSSQSWGQDFDDLWGLKKIHANLAWLRSQGSGVVAAVVDTGIDYNHPDIRPSLWTDPEDGSFGYNFVDKNKDPMDRNGHGTHIAGTIAAAGDNGLGLIGLAFKCRIMAVKGLADDGTGFESNLASSIVYAADNGADVINLSWIGSGSSPLVQDAVNYAHSQGVVVVASAGNGFLDLDLPQNAVYPAGFPSVITVSASDPGDRIAKFSNFGRKIDVAAPGVGILSLRAAGSAETHDGGLHIVGAQYCWASGTSMAAPHVSALAALILSEHPDYGNEKVREVIRESAAKIGAAGSESLSGELRIDAKNALGDELKDALACGPPGTGEVYSFPNPAPRSSTIFAKVGLADEVKLGISDVSGKSVASAALTEPSFLNGGYGYAYLWDTAGAASGNYIFHVDVKKGGSFFRCSGKVSVVK